MPDWLWTILLLALVCALVYGAFWIGRSMAGNGNSTDAATGGTDIPAGAQSKRDAVATGQRAPPRPSAPPPPALAGARGGLSGNQPVTAPKRSAPPPAAAAGAKTASANAPAPPKRTSTPPPAQAAWSGRKPDGTKKS